MEKVDNNNELFEEINNTYPAFLNDFNKTLETLNHELKDAGILLKEYTETIKIDETTNNNHETISTFNINIVDNY